jgi:hypothetical protein
MHFKEAITSWEHRTFKKLLPIQPYIFHIAILMELIWEINILMATSRISLITFSKKIG